MELNIKQIKFIFENRTRHHATINYFFNSGDIEHFQNDYKWFLEDETLSNDSYSYNIKMYDKKDNHKAFEFLIVLSKDIRNKLFNLSK